MSVALALVTGAEQDVVAIAMCRAGLDLTGHELAISAASHLGEPYHLVAVRGRRELMVGLLEALGVDGLAPLATSPVLGHGKPVGEVRVVPHLIPSALS